MSVEVSFDQNAIYAINLGFVFLCGVLVVLMQLGFAMFEAGLNAKKNAANILFKNLADFSIGAFLFYLFGYGIMFPEKYSSSELITILGFEFGIGIPNSVGAGIEWFYQMAFAATAATIVSGAVAGRMQFKAYIFYSAVLVGFVYPIVGRFLWSDMGYFSNSFHDFAGSIVVHAVGGVTALAAVIVLRPRIGRFSGEFIGHHNLVFALLGTILLWVGWYGFNGGSISSLIGTNTEETKESIKVFSNVVANTTLGAVAGTLSAVTLGYVPNKRLDLKTALNGALGGLVAITANCDLITPLQALSVGGFAGLLVITGELILEWLKKDDTVGAFAVHGLCGIFGGIVAGIAAGDDINVWSQLQAIGAMLSFVFIVMLTFFYLLKRFDMLEVSLDDERKGLDISEHKLEAYR